MGLHIVAKMNGYLMPKSSADILNEHPLFPTLQL